MAPTIEAIDDKQLIIGEGPHWDAEAQVLYYVDILDSTVYKYDARTKKVTHVLVDKEKKKVVSAVIPVAGTTDKFIIGYGAQVALLTWNGTSTTPTSVKVLDEELNTLNRFNDGKADSKGRLWIGTMGPEASVGVIREKSGSLYSLNENGKLKRHITGIGISNGLTWSPDNKIFYYIDTITSTIDAFDYDIENGEIANRRVIFDLKKNNVKGFPDGLTIDTEGKLWLATFQGNAVYRIDPTTSSILKRIDVPASKITSVAWGGAKLNELYVTTATLSEKEERYPDAGKVFKITNLDNIHGFPGVPVKLRNH